MNVEIDFFDKLINKSSEIDNMLSISLNELDDVIYRDLDSRVSTISINEYLHDIRSNINNLKNNVSKIKNNNQFSYNIWMDGLNDIPSEINMLTDKDGVPWAIKNLKVLENEETGTSYNAMVENTLKELQDRIKGIDKTIDEKYSVLNEYKLGDNMSLYGLLGIYNPMIDPANMYNITITEDGRISVMGFQNIEGIYSVLTSVLSSLENLKTFDNSTEFYQLEMSRIKSLTGTENIDLLITHVKEYLNQISQIYEEHDKLINERAQILSILYDKKIYDMVRPFETVINNKDFEEYSKEILFKDNYICLTDKDIEVYNMLPDYIKKMHPLEEGNYVSALLFNFINYETEDGIQVNPFFSKDEYISIRFQDLEYLNEEQKKIFYYQYRKNGVQSANDYLVALEDYLNRAKGYESYKNYRNYMISDATGVQKFFVSFGKGLEDGFEGSIEGFINAFYSDGIKSVNQYEQMYILNFLATEYTEEGLEEQLNAFKEGKIREEDYNNYKTIYDKVNESEEIQGIRKILYKGSYQVGTGIGYMAPAIALNVSVPGLGTGYLFLSQFGSKVEQSNQTYGELTTMAYANSFLSALASTALERLGGLPGFADEGAGILKNIFNEGWTEFVQQYVDRGFESVHYKTKYNIEEVTLEALESAILGFITAGVMDIGPKAITGTAMVLNVMGQEVKLNFQQMLKLYDTYKAEDPSIRSQKLIELGYELGIAKDVGFFNFLFNKSNHLTKKEKETYESITNLISDINLENYSTSELEKLMNRFVLEQLKLLVKLNPNNVNRIIEFGDVEHLATLLLDGTIDYEKNKYIYQQRFKTMTNTEFLRFLKKSMNGDFGVDQGIVRHVNLFYFKNSKKKSKFMKLIDLKGYEDYLINNKKIDKASVTNLINSIVSDDVFYNQELEYLMDYLMSKGIKPKKYNIIMNNFERIKKVEFDYAIDKLINMGFNTIEAHKILGSMDTVMGLCSYANIANAITLHFKNDIEGFKANFGYDMVKQYKPNEKKPNIYRLNSIELLLDMFLFFNSDISGDTISRGNPIFSLSGSKPKIIDQFSKNNIRGLSFSNGEIDKDLINSFFAYHNSLLQIDYYSFSPSSTLSTRYDPLKLYETDTIVERLKKSLEMGNLLSLGINRIKNFPINFNLLHGKKYLSTLEWSEGSSHAVQVIGIKDDNLIVSSWGKELYIPISELFFEEIIENIGPNGDIIKSRPVFGINGLTIPNTYSFHRIVPKNANMNLLWIEEIL